MPSLWPRCLVVALLLLETVGRSGAPATHSLHYFYTALSEHGHGMPLFVQVGYVDDQPITHYDSNSRKKVPLAPWMRKVEEDDPNYWKWGSQTLQGTESYFGTSLEILQARYNQSRGGLHTWQGMYSCEVGPDGQFKGGNIQFAYDGEDFIALDTETLTWTAPVPQALPTKKRWEKTLDNPHSFSNYLLDVCTPWLRKYLDYGRETFLRTETPTVRVTRKEKDVDLETLVCYLYGFYPKEIDVTWMKDGVDQISETFTGGIVPNADGTYYTWRSIDIDPKERDRYQCRVEHDSLEKSLDLAWEELASPLGLILGILLGAILAVAIIVEVIVFLRKRSGKDYRAAPIAIPEA